jgi:hypothetical protein
MPSKKKTKKPHKSYYWNDVLEWERQAKEEEEAKLAHDEIEIKQEIVLDPNE